LSEETNRNFDESVAVYPKTVEPMSYPIAGQNHFDLSVTAEGVDFYAVMDRVEGMLIRQALALSGGSKTKAAALLGLKRPCLTMKMKKLGMMG
jgi:DNA-binding NtrC family response regulator